jgi:hypothetical protein
LTAATVLGLLFLRLGEGEGSGRPSMPMRRATRLGVRGVPASEDGAVALLPVLRRPATASASKAGSTCTPIWMSRSSSPSSSRLFLGASRPPAFQESHIPNETTEVYGGALP